jgi:hypothetical protein
VRLRPPLRVSTSNALHPAIVAVVLGGLQLVIETLPQDPTLRQGRVLTFDRGAP